MSGSTKTHLCKQFYGGYILGLNTSHSYLHDRQGSADKDQTSIAVRVTALSVSMYKKHIVMGVTHYRKTFIKE